MIDDSRLEEVVGRYAELTASLRKLHPQSLDSQMTAIHRAMRNEIEKLLQERLKMYHLYG